MGINFLMFTSKISKVIMPTARNCGFKQAAIVAMQQKGFSSVEHVARGGAKLTKALDKELKYENDNYAQQEDIDTFIAEAGWSFTEEEQGMSENYCDFMIMISDMSGNSGLIVDATTMDTEVNYNSVQATE